MYVNKNLKRISSKSTCNVNVYTEKRHIESKHN